MPKVHKMREIKHVRAQILKTKDLREPNAYAIAMDGECSHIAFNEERVPHNKGLWRSKIFETDDSIPMDLEIGTGNGHHFAHHAQKNPDRRLLGIELKYKPIILTVRKLQLQSSTNARIMRYHAFNIEDLFVKNELNNIFIHFPDPWTTPNKPQHRIVNRNFLNKVFEMQRPGSFLEFKTDSRVSFLWTENEIAATPYKVEIKTYDLHNSPLAKNNFITKFETIFLKQKMPINYVRLIKK